MIRVLAFAFVLSLAVPASAQPMQQIFAEANAAYFAGSYDDATRGYEQLVRAGVNDPDVTFNLATAHARAGRYGEAIRYFERTLSLRPGDAEAELGLASAVTAAGRRRAEVSGEATITTRPPFHEALVREVHEDVLAWLSVALDFGLFVALMSLLFVRRETPRLAAGIVTPLLGAALALALFGLAVKRGTFDEGRRAIVVAPETLLLEGPDPRARTRATAYEGERAMMVRESGQYVKVVLPGGRVGWARATDVGLI